MDKPQQPKPKPKTPPTAQLPLGMLKKHIDDASIAGKLRDRKQRVDDAIEKAGG